MPSFEDHGDTGKEQPGWRERLNSALGALHFKSTDKPGDHRPLLYLVPPPEITEPGDDDTPLYAAGPLAAKLGRLMRHDHPEEITPPEEPDAAKPVRHLRLIQGGADGNSREADDTAHRAPFKAPVHNLHHNRHDKQ